MQAKTYRIDAFPENASRYVEGYVVVAVDVIRATTTAVTAASLGWKCYPTGSLESAWELARKWQKVYLAGEVNGEKPTGFHINNSPTELVKLTDVGRPIILLSSSGTKLIENALKSRLLFLACFRNAACTAGRLIREGYPKIALLGAGSRGEFREEDQIACAWIADRLEGAGYAAEDAISARIVQKWRKSASHACIGSKSVDYLRRSNQFEDLRFILNRVNDLRSAFIVSAAGFVSKMEPENDTAALQVETLSSCADES